MAPPDAFSLPEGAVFHDQYEVVRRIDSGAMGTVYEVIDRRTKRRRALKLMLARFADNPEVTERFRREATITADIVSEHVVETFDAGVDKASGLPFLVMELLRGEDLGKILARGPLPAADVVTYLMQTASALDRMHEASIVHRDLKPENLFLTRRDDGAPRIKILDFGIAKVIEKTAVPSATSTRNMGTPVYMSPEQVTGAGPVGPSADLYAVGHLAYTMLTGEAYWLEDALAHETVYPLLLRIMEGVVEPASVRALRTRKVTLPPAFDGWFARATAHDPEARFPRATDSIVALAAALDVPRPVLPSWPIDPAIAAAPTLQPPRDDGDDGHDPIPLLPALPAFPEAERLPSGEQDPLRTLSPVSTLPGSSKPPPASTPRSPRTNRAIFALGAAFFVTGVAAAILFARPRPAATTTASATSLDGPPTAAPPPSDPTPASPPSASTPAPSVTPDPPPASTPSSSTTTTAHPTTSPRRTPGKKPAAPPSSGPPRPSRPYGDPASDL